MVKTYTVDKPLFTLGNTLGEGTTLTAHDPPQRPVIANNVCRVCLGSYTRHQESPISACSDLRQDSRSKRLYFVDIDQKKLYTYEPSSGTIGYDVFDHKITAIALLEKGEGVST